MDIRPRRSVLYMPGSNLRALEKARSLAADTLVLDLEDSVAPEKKILAREQVMTEVAAGGYGRREIIVRANSLDSEWGEGDIRAIAQSEADAVCLPKVETAADVTRVIAMLNAAAAPTHMQLWAMIETPVGVSNVEQIAAADPRMAVLVMGTTDLAKELRVPHTPGRLGLQYSLGRCVLAARTHHKDILDGVYLDLEDETGFANSCHQGVELGFDGKTLIHPKQLAAANDIFGPAAGDIERAHKIIEAWRQAAAEGKAVVVVDGQLIEGMHVDEAQRCLKIAELLDLPSLRA